MKNSLSTKGLSLSQAQSISNLCNQRAIDIESQISGCNNYEKSLEIDKKIYIETQAKPIPSNIVDLLKEKAALHSVQAFLMENIRAKDIMIKDLQCKRFMSTIDKPKIPEYKNTEILNNVGEDWGWNQLTVTEYNEYLEAEAFAAHIGQFIHRGGQLDKLRTELPRIKTLEWIEVKKDERTPLNVKIHHTSENLLKLHEELAALHRVYEQKVNYYKAKVKNLVTEENARIARVNADCQTEVNAINSRLRSEFDTALAAWEEKIKVLSQEFEESRQKEIKEAASLRIEIDSRFQTVIDKFLKQLE